MGIGEAVKKGFSLSGKLMKVVLIFFILNSVMGLASLPLASPEKAGQPGVVAISLILSIVFFVIFVFLQGGALGLAKDVHKTGNCSMPNFAVYGKKFYLRILGLLLLYVLIAIGVVLVLGLIGSGILAVANNVVTRTIVGGVAGLVALLAIVLLLLPIYSIIADDIGSVQALKKGIGLAKANFWQLLGLFVLLVLISVIISLIIGFIIGLATIPLPFNVTQIVITIVNSLVQSYIPIVMMLALMGYYLGLAQKEAGGPQQNPS